jgi:hypothetical protein
MKLYLWNEPYQVSYGSSLVFAVASSLEEAKEIATTKATSWSYGDCQKTGIPLRDLGEPTRVLDLPCAEWHRWEE